MTTEKLQNQGVDAVNWCDGPMHGKEAANKSIFILQGMLFQMMNAKDSSEVPGPQGMKKCTTIFLIFDIRRNSIVLK